ncbi:MAG: DNA translocase FtsK 4TM domain-containing protein [Planctomycetota bacterium]
MAKQGKATGRKPGTKKRTKKNARGSARRRQLLTIVLGGIGAFLFLALVSWAPEGSSRGNLCGGVGQVLAEPILAWLGFGAFALFGVLAYWGVAALLGLRLLHPALRIGGIALVTICSGAFLALTVEDSAYAGGGLYGPGGLAGGGLAHQLSIVSGAIGAFLVTTTGALFGLALATDWLFVEVVRDIARAIQRAGTWILEHLPHLAEVAGRGVGKLKPVAAGLTQSTATLPEAPPKKVEVVLEEYEEVEEYEEEEEFEEPEPVEDWDEEPESVAPPPKPKPAPKRKPAPRKPRKKAPVGDGVFPPVDLLDQVKPRDPRAQDAMIKANADILEKSLREFGVEADVVAFTCGPVVTLYELSLAPGVKVNRIHNLSEDLAVALKAGVVRVVAPLPGRSTIGVEVPNQVREDVRFRSIYDENVGKNAALPLFLGTDVAGAGLVEDLSTMPHMLIAGATGTGKSVCINAILVSLLMTRTIDQVRMILIDPKQVELAFFSKVPHLMSPVVTDMKKAITVLEWLVEQMEQRYDLFHTTEVRNIRAYNELGKKKIAERKKEIGYVDDDLPDGRIGIPDSLPYIVIVVDELADLMMVAGKEIENLITRLAQKSRAVGIHIILATQRPSTDVITGLIKANMPSRCSFQVASKIDSRVILDQNGADKLLGRGDMLFLPPGTSHLVRAQGTFVSDDEVKKVCRFLATNGDQEFDESLTEAQSGRMLDDAEKDPLYDDAVRIIIEQQRGSASLLQRALGVGYTRGSRLMDQMHKEGIVGAYKGSKARDVLMTLDEYEEVSKARAKSRAE